MHGVEGELCIRNDGTRVAKRHGDLRIFDFGYQAEIEISLQKIIDETRKGKSVWRQSLLQCRQKNVLQLSILQEFVKTNKAGSAYFAVQNQYGQEPTFVNIARR